MSMSEIYRRTKLSQEFFKTIFTDAFMFKGKPFQILEKTSLSEDEKNFAIGIYNASIYKAKNFEACVDICENTRDIFSWQDNSEGPLVFCGKILFLLKIKKKDVAWFVNCWSGSNESES